MQCAASRSASQCLDFLQCWSGGLGHGGSERVLPAAARGSGRYTGGVDLCGVLCIGCLLWPDDEQSALEPWGIREEVRDSDGASRQV